MNYLKVLVLFPLIFLAASCSDDSDGDGCLSPEEIAGSACPASDLLLVCEPYFCGGSFPPDEDDEGVVFDFFLPPPDTECEVIDCGTLDCEGGIFADLEINEFGHPSGVIFSQDGSRQSSFSSCTIFQ